MHEIIYNIYIWDYHYETCIDEEWLKYNLEVAKNKAKGKPVRVEKEKVPAWEVDRMINRNIDHCEQIWEEAKKTKNPEEYVERYFMIQDIKAEIELAIHNT